MWMGYGEREWAAVTQADVGSVSFQPTERINAASGSVSLSLGGVGYVALDRGAEVEFVLDTVRRPPHGHRLAALRVGRGRVFVDGDSAHGSAVHVERVRVELAPGARVLIQSTEGAADVDVVESIARVYLEGLEDPIELARGTGCRIRSNALLNRDRMSNPRLRPHEVAFLAARVGRDADELWRRTAGWGRERAALERLTRDALAAAASPSANAPIRDAADPARAAAADKACREKDADREFARKKRAARATTLRKESHDDLEADRDGSAGNGGAGAVPVGDGAQRRGARP